MKRVNGFVLREIADEILLVPTGEVSLIHNEIINLNHTGKLLWELLEQDQREEDLLQALLDTYEVDAETARKDLERFLGRLREIGIILEE